MWILFALLVLGIVAVIALVAARPRAELPDRDADPLFVAGIAIAGASAALVATLGLMMLPMTLAGVVCIAVGAHRSRPHHSS
jgi:hypothetical protein